MAESSGELLGGRYRLLGERTSFPFGAWWESEDDQGARTIVLRMNPEVADPGAKAKAAIATTAGLDAAHIVAWTDGGVDAKGNGWLAAPMFGPWSLTEHVSRSEGVSPAEAAPLMHQIVRAVASAEAAGVLHNTLTSEFIRLVPLPEGGYGVKVYGFGLADLLPSFKPLRKQDAYLGVPDYMSPELCAGKAAEGSSADIYALGIIMYEAVRGRPPFAPTFASASASTTLKRHIFEKPLPLHVRYANAPFIKTYEAVAFKALAKTANRRQATVAELEKELEQLIVEEMRSQVVSLAAVSGRGPTTSRRLRTQVIAQVQMDEPSIVLRADPPADDARAAVEAAVAAAQAESETDADVHAEEEEEAEQAAAPASPRRGDATLVFAGLGPAVRELAEAARKEEEDVEGSSEEEAEPAGTSGPQTRRGKKKKGRKGSSASVIVSNAAATQVGVDRPPPEARPSQGVASVGTTPSSATVVTSKVSETSTAEGAGATASARGEPSGARIRKKDEATSAAAGKAKPASKGKDDQDEWFSDEDVGGRRKGSRAWIFLLLAAAVVIVVVILLMTSGKDDRDLAPVGVIPAVPAQRYPLAEDELQEAVGARVAPDGDRAARQPNALKPVDPTATLTAAGPAVAPTPPSEDKPAPPEPARIDAPIEIEAPAKVEAAKIEAAVEPAKPEAPPVEPARIEAPARIEPTKLEAPPKVEPAKVAAPPKVESTKLEAPPKVEPAKVATPPKVEPTKVEPTKVEPAKVATPPKVEPAKVATPPKVEPAKVETPAKVDPAGSPEDQFRAKAKHYIELGMQAYKGENYKLAIGYFKKAQEADPSNIQAARYLKQAMEKAGQ